MPTRLAVLGGGIFVRNAYLPFLEQHPGSAQLVAVWSRSETTAANVSSEARQMAPHVRSYHGEAGLDELLSVADVEAVLVVVAPQAMLEVVKKALAAGKHVLSEKPAGPTFAAVQELLHWRSTLPDPPLWAEPAFIKASELASTMGHILKLDLVADVPITPGSKYYGSDWRRDTAGLPGGFMTETSVHFLAALRMLARAAGWGEAVAASGVATSTRPDLPPPDTLVGMVLFQSGGAAAVSICFAGTVPCRSITATGIQGTVEARQSRWQGDRSSYEVKHQLAEGTAPTTERVAITGVGEAILSFLHCVRAHRAGGGRSAAAKPQPGAVEEGSGNGGSVAAEHAYRVSSVEAAKDLLLIESLLKSSLLGGQQVQVEHL